MLPLLLTALAMLAAGRAARGGSTLPAGFTDTVFVSGLESPTAMAFLPDGRLLICEQDGRLRVARDGRLLPESLLTVNPDANGERGLLGAAPHPGFETEPYLYLYYTARQPQAHNRVSRFMVQGDRAVPGSEQVLVELEALTASTNHNGGAIHFGPDGRLYAATGDNQRGAQAQSLDSRLGKILRYHADGSIPEDPPFGNQTQGANRAIWAMGLRNPFTFAFHPDTGRMFINDVGEHTWEEINDGLPGANYGWPVVEGPSNDHRFQPPLHAYSHAGNPGSCGITGGAFYNPPVQAFPTAYRGRYFFADFCGGWIRTLQPDTRAAEAFAEGLPFPVDLDVGPDGALYCLTRGDGAVHRIAFAGEGRAVVLEDPRDARARVGTAATFSVVAGGSPPLSYQWQRNTKDIRSATGTSFTLDPVTLADQGARFRCVVSNAIDTAVSAEAVLTLEQNAPPQVQILTPKPGGRYRAGQVLRFSGRAVDPEDGVLPARSFTWNVEFHHEEHVHPFKPAITGRRAGKFAVPFTGETAPNVFYRIRLTARDSEGLDGEAFVDVQPRTAELRLATQPPGLQVTLDAQPRTAPHAETSVAGLRRRIGAPSPQEVNGTRYVFTRWSDRGAREHAIRLPTGGRTYTAVFRRAQ